MSEEIDNVELDTWLKETQIFIHNSLQTIITQVLDNIKESDPITVITLINQISEVYLENIKTEWSKLSSDRKSYEESVRNDLEKLSEEIV